MSRSAQLNSNNGRHFEIATMASQLLSTSALIAQKNEQLKYQLFFHLVQMRRTVGLDANVEIPRQLVTSRKRKLQELYRVVNYVQFTCTQSSKATNVNYSKDAFTGVDPAEEESWLAEVDVLQYVLPMMEGTAIFSCTGRTC